MVGKSESAGTAKPASKAKAAGDKPAPKKAAGDRPAPKKAAPKASTARAAAAKAAALKTASGPRGGSRVKITQVGSPIGRKSDQRATLRALGLNKINRSREIDDTPSIRGMLRKVGHLLRIESVN